MSFLKGFCEERRDLVHCGVVKYACGYLQCKAGNPDMRRRSVSLAEGDMESRWVLFLFLCSSLFGVRVGTQDAKLISESSNTFQ